MRFFPIKPFLIMAALAGIFFFLRLGWPGTIEFGYDQPRIALSVMAVWEKRDFLDVVKYIHPSNASPDTITWGPFLIYFLTPFFLFSRHPVVISQLIALFNFLGIIFTYLLGKKLFNARVGWLAAFFLAVSPWAVVFSRMIYNPSPLLTFAPLIIYLSVLIIKENKKNILLFLPSLWSAVLQFHFLSLSLVVVSFSYLIFNRQQIAWRKFFLGLLFSLILWLPLLKYELVNGFRLSRGFLKAPFLMRINNQPLYEDKTVVLKHFFKVLSGRDFFFQLGYAYRDFFDSLPSWFLIYQKVFSFLFLFSLVFILLRVISQRKKDELLLFAWLASLPFFIQLFSLPEIVPRYFLIILPASCLILALFLENFLRLIFKNTLLINISVLFFVLIVGFNQSFFIIKYYNFILKYSYPQSGWMGWLSRTSDPPFSFGYQALNFALREGEKQGFKSIVFSNDENVKNQFHYNWAQKYIWQYVFKKDFRYSSKQPHYFILLGPVEDQSEKQKIKRFGPYSVYQLENI